MHVETILEGDTRQMTGKALRTRNVKLELLSQIVNRSQDCPYSAVFRFLYC